MAVSVRHSELVEGAAIFAEDVSVSLGGNPIPKGVSFKGQAWRSRRAHRPQRSRQEHPAAGAGRTDSPGLRDSARGGYALKRPQRRSAGAAHRLHAAARRHAPFHRVGNAGLSHMKRGLFDRMLTKCEGRGRADERALGGGIEGLEDPRAPNARRHDLHDILVIAFCTMLCGGQTCTDYGAFRTCQEGVTPDFSEAGKRHTQPRHLLPYPGNAGPGGL